ncbi:MAG: hypothetical protein LBU11_11885, partial [Zoogloeaceae bacterium]|nr:hypothetical protein [Zoogloeaceae bacterium]
MDSPRLAASFPCTGRDRLPDPAAGTATCLQRYGSGHVHGILFTGETLADFERDGLHREIKRTQGGLQSSRAWDALGRLRRYQASGRFDGAEKDN